MNRNSKPAVSQRLLSALGRRGASHGSLIAILIAGFLGYLQVMPNLMLVLIVAGAVIIEFARRLDEGIPLMQSTALIACLQWLVGPMLAYNIDLTVGRYGMYVDEFTYFGFALPATAAFVVGALATGNSIKQRVLLAPIDRSNFVRIGILLNVISFGADIAFRPGGLAFLFHLLAQLRYVGIIYFILSGHSWRWLLTGAAFLPLLLRSAEAAMFHDLILWGMLIFFYWFANESRSLRKKLVILSAGCLAVFTLQIGKQQYREQVSKGESASVFSESVDVWVKGELSEESFGLALARLNQGWIISAVLKNVPSFEPFARGETIKDALVASFLPRVLAPDKKQAGGQENFRRFTGLGIEVGTSMGISVLGEAYGNFGREGGIAGMLVYGLAFSYAFAACARHAAKFPTFLLWLPLIFYQAIKAETELVVVMNQVIKGGLVAVAMYHLVRSYFPDRLSGPIALKRPGRLKGPSPRLLKKL